MAYKIHEVRDPIHVFIKLDSEERKVLDSRPFQRLRYITQLALTYLVYPGATHKRFEHSLGVMELAGRVYDTITHPNNLCYDSVRALVPPKGDFKDVYWRRVLRMAALCHDLGHLPFSHGAEELLPEGWDHERLTIELIFSEELKSIWNELSVNPEHVAKLSVGAKYSKFKNESLTPWEALLSEIIVGNAFGVDRMDYLLRDSHHAGVTYGRFDHYRLIDTLRILPKIEGSESLELGVEEGGIRSAEAMLLARFFMFSQLYFHHVRRIYDIHLKDFLKAWLKDGFFASDLEQHLIMTDNEVMTALLHAARDEKMNGHNSAKRIYYRKHFKRLYQRNPQDMLENSDPTEAIYKAACAEYGKENLRKDISIKANTVPDFPVLLDGRIVSCFSISPTLAALPPVSVNCVFINPDLLNTAHKWLNINRQQIFSVKGEEE